MKGVGCLQSKYPSKLLSAITGTLKHWPISSSSVVFTESFPAYGIFLVFKTTPGIWRIKGWRSRTFRNLGKTFPPRSTREVNNVSCYFFHGLASLKLPQVHPLWGSRFLQSHWGHLEMPVLPWFRISQLFSGFILSFIIMTNIYSASCHGQSSISGSQGTTELNAPQIFPFRMLLGSPEAYGIFFSVRETGMCLQL